MGKADTKKRRRVSPLGPDPEIEVRKTVFPLASASRRFPGPHALDNDLQKFSKVDGPFCKKTQEWNSIMNDDINSELGEGKLSTRCL